MSFQTYRPDSTGSKNLNDGVSISRNQIYFGKFKPPYEYLVVEYDTSETAIRFSRGDSTNGFKVHNGKKGEYFMNCRNFTKHEYLPKGRYAKVAELTYKQTKSPTEATQERKDI